jgi:hypothetical protein
MFAPFFGRRVHVAHPFPFIPCGVGCIRDRFAAVRLDPIPLFRGHIQHRRSTPGFTQGLQIQCFIRRLMANAFDTDVLIQAEDPMKAADFCVKELGFEITDNKPNMISLHGTKINFFIERGPVLGPVFEVLAGRDDKDGLQCYPRAIPLSAENVRHRARTKARMMRSRKTIVNGRFLPVMAASFD